jgi:hypothetical protein
MQRWDSVFMFLYFLLYWHYGPKKRSDFTRLGDGLHWTILSTPIPREERPNLNGVFTYYSFSMQLQFLRDRFLRAFRKRISYGKSALSHSDLYGHNLNG